MKDSAESVRGSSLAGTAAALEDDTYRTLKWRLIPFLMLCYVVSYLDRVNIGFAKLQMLGDLHFSETTYGLGAGVFFIGYVLCGVPSNLMLHRVGAKAWIALIMVTWGVLSGLMAFVTTPAQFYILRLLLGAAESGFLPGIILYLTYWFPGARRARMVSMFQAAIPISGVLGGPVSGMILDHLNGHLGFRGWQWLFLIEALPALILGLSAWFCLDNGIEQAHWLTPTQKELLTRTIKEEDALKESSSVRTILADGRLWRLCLLALGLVIGVYAVSFWMPTVLKEAGARSSTEVGWLSAIPNLIAVPGMLLFARSSDLRRERRWHVASAALLGALGLACTAMFTHELVLAVFALSLATTGLISAVPMQWSFVTAFLGGSSGAAAIGLLNSVGNLGGLISPPLIGWLKDTTGSLQTGLLAIAACAVVSALLALSVPARLVNR
jgi:D-galactonate transporter